MNTIKELWDLLPHPPITNPTIRWFAKDPNEQWGGYADSARELENAILHSPGKNFYVCPNPSSSRVGIRHSTKDVSHWSWFLLDVDPVVKSGFDPQPLLTEALLWMSEWMGRRLDPVIIDSGRGMQAWIRLNDLVLDDNPDVLTPEKIDAMREETEYVERRVARLTMRWWLNKLRDKLGEQHGCQIDPTCSDLPRPMRCPGTVNLKTGRTAELQWASHTVHKGLAKLLVTGVPADVLRPVIVPSVAAGTEWQDVLVHLTVKAQNYLIHGKTEPGRHETMWHAARCLAEKGLTREAVQRALVYANSRRGKDNELEPKDIEHALDTAFSRLTTDTEIG